jgi:hypothetical protein
MKRTILLVSALALAGCGQAGDGTSANEAAAKPAQPKKRIAYCFFKDAETKAWAASRGKDGNIVVKGKAYRSDPRYKALLNPATVTGTTAELSPTIAQNDTGFAADENWWDVSATIANSATVDTVRVFCGAKTFAELKVPLKT